MLFIETKKEPTVTNSTTSAAKRGRRKSNIGILSYLKHSVLGCLVAIASFSTALAMQPAIAAEDSAYMKYSPALVADATTEDLAILERYMDQDILSDIKIKTDAPDEVIALYVQKDSNFIEVVEDYFN